MASDGTKANSWNDFLTCCCCVCLYRMCCVLLTCLARVMSRGKPRERIDDNPESFDKRFGDVLLLLGDVQFDHSLS